MRVHLAVQVVSNSVVDLIEKYENREIKDYSSLKMMIVNVDWLVDLWNGDRRKGYENINSPNHEYLTSFLSILKVFADWRRENMDYNT